MWPTIKSVILLVIILTLRLTNQSWLVVVLASLFLVTTYQHVVVLLSPEKLHYMPAMDQATFISTSQAPVNFISVTGIEGKITRESVMQIVKRNIHRFPKFRYKIIMRFGDLYYEEITEEQALERAFFFEDRPEKILKSQHEVDCFVRDNLNVKMPMDGPQFRVCYMPFKDDDGTECYLQIWKQHHCIMDGVSCMAV